jgi:hypothetical protein
MDPEVVRETLKEALRAVANKAKVDAQRGESDIGSVFGDDIDPLPAMDIAKIEEAIVNIDKATATKEGARRLINGILVVAKIAARVFPA